MRYAVLLGMPIRHPKPGRVVGAASDWLMKTYLPARDMARWIVEAR